jgi:YVTN family beta-propeller protein
VINTREGAPREGIIQSQKRKRSFTLCWAAVCPALALASGLGTPPAAAAPYAFVASFETNPVSVIDTAANLVRATVAVGRGPTAVAVSPEGTTRLCDEL